MLQEAARWLQAPVPFVASWTMLARGAGPPGRSGQKEGHTVSGWLGRDVWLGPPVEVCAGFELIVIENATALGHDVLEISKRRKVLVGEWLVEDGPEVFGGLKLGRVWGQVGEPEALRHSQVRRGVPAGAVQPEHDEAIPSRPGLAGKQREQRGEERLGDPVRHVPEHLAGDRLDEGGDVQPL